MKEYKTRIVDKIIDSRLKSVGGIVIEGPKWCGKTTTGAHFAESIIRIDEPSKKEQNIYLSSINPSSLLSGNTPRLIDEWQLAPKLWDACRYEIDERSEFGQFILTGSSVPVSSDDITHSGTGRFAWVKMRTMSLYESGESSGEISLAELFNNPSAINGYNKLSFNDLSYVICRGGWPASIALDRESSLLSAYDYYDGIVNYDLNRVDGIKKNQQRVKRLLRSLSRNQGTQSSLSLLKEDLAINDTDSLDTDTISSYISALTKIYVVEDMQAWNPNLRSKVAVRTSDTRYFSDPSIAVASLGLGPKDLTNDLNTFGILFETLCIRDLRIYAESIRGNVYHYRDKSDLECDAVIHLQNGKYGLCEIKLGGDKLIEEACKNLFKLRDKLDIEKMNAPSFMMVLVGVGDFAYRREDGIYVIPIGCLKD